MSNLGLNNRNNSSQRLGITEPISLGGPNELDVTKTQELEKVLVTLFIFSSFKLCFDNILNLEFGCLVFGSCWVV